MSNLIDFPNFDIAPNGAISRAFIQKNILAFDEACKMVGKMHYGRNTNKENLLQIFLDDCGTCSTKHALLKALAIENNFESIQLMIGIFKMNAMNTPKIKTVLEQYQLNYIPEAHCYLKYHHQILDFTKVNAKPSDFVDDLLEEIEIFPHQIGAFKINFHQNYLDHWLKRNPQIKYELSHLWAIREQCIQKLSE